MGIIVSMTAVAIHRQLGSTFERLAMTRGTTHSRMGTIQFELRLLVVIEPPQFPVVGVMAALASCSERSLVHVLFLVTFDAFPRRILERLSDVALLTRRDGMQSDQREPCQVMIEAHLPIP